ncbi:MAG: two-component regulator propeller domain-containing protein, partial [Bacteroidota bacterium]
MPLRLKLLFCLLAGCYLLEAQPLRLPFHHLTQEEGLSDTWNSFIHKDSRGFVWISSLEGLHRFDGSQVKVYRSNQSDSTSIAGNIVTSTFYEDALGNLWFTTYGAVNCYLRATDQFRSYTITDPNGKPYTADYYGFYLDGQKRFWVRVGLGAKGQLFVLNTLTSISKLIGPLDGQRVAVRSWGAQQVQLLSYYLSAGLVSTVVEKDQIIARDTLVDQMVSSIFMESDTSWWLGTTNGMLHYQSLTQRVEASTLFRGEALGTGHGIV